MLNMRPGQKIVASQLAGDFTLPGDLKEKLVFIAGGIGITPFRSMVKYLIDKNEKRDIIIFYSNRTMDDIAYKEVFDEAQNRLGIKTVYVLTNKNTNPSWGGEIGHVDGKMIAHQAPDYLHRIFYLSGSHAMVAAFEKTLKDLGVSRGRIKIDFFPGFA